MGTNYKEIKSGKIISPVLRHRLGKGMKRPEYAEWLGLAVTAEMIRDHEIGKDLAPSRVLMWAYEEKDLGYMKQQYYGFYAALVVNRGGDA